MVLVDPGKTFTDVPRGSIEVERYRDGGGSLDVLSQRPALSFKTFQQDISTE